MVKLPLYASERISPNSTLEIIEFEIGSVYVPEVMFGITLKLNTSPSLPRKSAFDPEYDTNLNVLLSIIFAAMLWSLALVVNAAEFST